MSCLAQNVMEGLLNAETDLFQCLYTVVGSNSKFDQQLKCQCDSTQLSWQTRSLGDFACCEVKQHKTVLTDLFLRRLCLVHDNYRGDCWFMTTAETTAGS